MGKDGEQVDRVSTLVRTLLGGGFLLENVVRRYESILFECYRVDEFGSRIHYLFVLTEDQLSRASELGASKYAQQRDALGVVIGASVKATLPAMSWDGFLARFGGPIRSWLPLEPAFPAQLAQLGHNRAVQDLLGRPDDLFEEFTHVGLQFLLAARVIRYGQDRRAEVVADGVALAGGRAVFLYDAKAYADGYVVSRNTVRQFSDYVRAFHAKYEAYVGRLHVFLLVSGHFKSDQSSLQQKSADLYAESGVPLCYLAADVLGQATALLAKHPQLRTVLDWKTILAPGTEVTLEVIERAVKAALKDGIVPAAG